MKLHLDQIIHNHACQAGCDFFRQHADSQGFATLEQIEKACRAAGALGQQYWDWLMNQIHQPEFYLVLKDHVYSSYRVAQQECATLAEAQALSRERQQIYPHLIHEWSLMRKISDADQVGFSWIYLHDPRYLADPLTDTE